MGQYLAEQIRIGRLDYQKTINSYPEYKEDIDNYLEKYSYIEVEEERVQKFILQVLLRQNH